MTSYAKGKLGGLYSPRQSVLKKMATNLQLIPYGEEADLFVNGHVNR